MNNRWKAYWRPATGGVFRRRVCVSSDHNMAVAELEDDFHRFGVTVRHDGDTVTEVAGRATRYPWSTCAEAADNLSRLAGMKINSLSSDVYLYTDGAFQCTHMFELAGLAIAQAARGNGQLRFDATVHDPVDGVQAAAIARDGVTILEWEVKNTMILSPKAFEGQSTANLGQWAKFNFPPEIAECILILRRCVRTSIGRQLELDSIPDAVSFGAHGVCHSFQPHIAPRGKRNVGSVRDFSTQTDQLLPGLQTTGQRGKGK